MKAKRMGLIVSFAAFAALIAVACKNPSVTANGEAPPQDYGTVKVQTAEPQAATRTARTALPSMDFDRLEYVFSRTETAEAFTAAPDGGGYFTLEVGSYTVEVKAITNNTLSAVGVSPEFAVVSGEQKTVIVPLAAATVGVGEFAYLITYPPDAWADITLLKYPLMSDVGLSPSHVCDDSGISEAVELSAGSYLLTVQLSMNGRTAGTSEAVLVYPGLTTEYVKEFTVEDFIAVPPVEGGVKCIYYFVDQHGSLITTNDTMTVAPGETVAIAAIDDGGFSNHQWYVNGEPSGQSGNTFNFSSETPGRYTVGLFVEKNGRLYNTNIVITVEGTATAATRAVTVDMLVSYDTGWEGSSALRIAVNGVDIADNVKVHTAAADNTPAGQRTSNTFTFPVSPGDDVSFYWVAGTLQRYYAFIVYYTDTPPIPAFTLSNITTWNGANALLYRLRGVLAGTSNGTLLGSFTVQ